MGLDSSIYKRTTNEKMKIINTLKNERDNNEEVLYWRKNYKIHEYFCDNFYVENCQEAILSMEDILDFIQFLKGEDFYEFEVDNKDDIKKLTELIEEMKGGEIEVYYWAWW